MSFHSGGVKFLLNPNKPVSIPLEDLEGITFYTLNRNNYIGLKIRNQQKYIKDYSSPYTIKFDEAAQEVDFPQLSFPLDIVKNKQELIDYIEKEKMEVFIFG